MRTDNLFKTNISFSSSSSSSSSSSYVAVFEHENHAPIIESDHQEGCTLIEPSTHTCARAVSAGGERYLRLFGRQADGYIDAARGAIRLQPPETDETDGSVPTILVMIRSLQAVTYAGERGNKEAFSDPLAEASLADTTPTIECMFDEEIQRVSLIFPFGTNGATIKIHYSVSETPRAVPVGVFNGEMITHNVDLGVVKMSIEIDGNPFPGGVYPPGTTDLLITMEVCVVTRFFIFTF